MRAVWPDISVTDDSLVQCVKEMRRALGDESRQIITTLVKRGYIFEAVVEYEHDMPSATTDSPVVAIAATANTQPSGERLPSVAVLPFDDMSLTAVSAIWGTALPKTSLQCWPARRM